MPSLSESELKVVDQACAGDVLSTTAIRLYQATKPTEYTYSQTGAFALLRNPISGYSFKMTGRVSWDQPIIGDIKYVKDRPHFHSFVGQSCMIGLSFADEGEGANFAERFVNREAAVRKISIPAAIPPPSLPQYVPQIIVKENSDKEPKEVKKESSGGGIFGFGRKGNGKGKVEKSMISDPSDFKHLSHVGFSKQSGFSAQNIPGEWKLIFQKAGITEDQMNDKKTIKVMKKFMRENNALVPNLSSESILEGGSPSQQRRAPPPPPPVRGAGRAPPPTPPTRTSTNARISTNARLPQIPDRQTPPPAVPSRATPPSIPNRSQPVLNAPPPPPVLPLPPKQPVATPAFPARTIAASTSALSAKPSGAAPAQDLLSAIRGGKQLKASAVSANDVSSPRADAGDDLADALRNALLKRVTAVAGADSDEEGDSDGSW